MVEFYRSKNESLFNIKDFPYEDKYLNNIRGFDKYKDIRMSYIDEGNKTSDLTFLMLHGSPTWSYLWRHFIKEVVDAKYRAVALDMIGFGRSDKPLEEEAYTFESMRESIISAIEQLDLKNIVLVVHEWGGFLGLTIPMEIKERIDGVIIHNTTLTTGNQLMSDSYSDWRKYIADNPDLNVRAIMARTNKILNLKECNTYHAPFDSFESKIALRTMPKIYPDHPDKPGAKLAQRSLDWYSEEFDGLIVAISGMRDPLFPQEAQNAFLNSISVIVKLPGVDNAGHFLPEWAMEYGKDLITNFISLRAKHILAKKELDEQEKLNNQDKDINNNA
tara:strand:- start:9577 stop:10572 length:996 start_codon:yes stop_codon:yes gene_type:complete